MTANEGLVDIGLLKGKGLNILRKTSVNHFNAYLQYLDRTETFDSLPREDFVPGFILGEFSDYLFKRVTKIDFGEYEVSQVWYNSHRNYISGIAGLTWKRFPELEISWKPYVAKLYKNIDTMFFDESGRTGKPLENLTPQPMISDFEYICKRFFELGVDYASMRAFVIGDTSFLGRVSEVT